MKVIITIIFILIARATYYFISERSNNESTQISNLKVEESRKEDNQVQVQESLEKSKTIREEITSEITNELKQELSKEDIDPEYAEQVSKEDFQEFITAAIEELDSGEDMAVALALEMRKIQVAQPLHQDIIRTFYEECLQKENLASEVKNLCRKSLDELR